MASYSCGRVNKGVPPHPGHGQIVCASDVTVSQADGHGGTTTNDDLSEGLPFDIYLFQLHAFAFGFGSGLVEQWRRRWWPTRSFPNPKPRHLDFAAVAISGKARDAQLSTLAATPRGARSRRLVAEWRRYPLYLMVSETASLRYSVGPNVARQGGAGSGCYRDTA